MKSVIDKDLALMHMMASWLEKLSHDGKRLKPKGSGCRVRQLSA